MKNAFLYFATLICGIPSLLALAQEKSETIEERCIYALIKEDKKTLKELVSPVFLDLYYSKVKNNGFVEMLDIIKDGSVKRSDIASEYKTYSDAVMEEIFDGFKKLPLRYSVYEAKNTVNDKPLFFMFFVAMEKEADKDKEIVYSFSIFLDKGQILDFLKNTEL